MATLLGLMSSFAHAAPLGTAFTYHGQLTDGGAPAIGIYDLRFTIYDLASGGTPVAGPITNSPVGVTNGLFATLLGPKEDSSLNFRRSSQSIHSSNH